MILLRMYVSTKVQFNIIDGVAIRLYKSIHLAHYLASQMRLIVQSCAVWCDVVSSPSALPGVVVMLTVKGKIDVPLAIRVTRTSPPSIN